MDMAIDGAAAPSLASLLHQSRSLAAQQGRSDLPAIQLGLEQIEAQSRRLVARAAPGAPPPGAHEKAHYFLAGAGVDASQLGADVRRVELRGAFEMLEAVGDTDVESFLRHSHEHLILSSIEEGRRETLADFNQSMARGMAHNWQKQRARIFEELGQHASTSAAEDFTSAGPQRGASAPPQTQLHGRMMRYDSVLSSLSSARLASQPFPLASALSTAVSTGSAPSAADAPLAEAWAALASIVGEQVDAKKERFVGPAVRERQFARAYGEAWEKESGRELRNQIGRGGMEFLQRQFEQHMDSTIAANPVKAQLGGAPSMRARVAAFVRVVHLDRDGRWSGDLELVSTPQGPMPVWAHIYYLLRTGHSSLALDVASEHDAALRSSDQSGSSSGGSSFVAYLKAWLDSPDRRLPKALRDRFLAEYNARFRSSSSLDASSVDAYKAGLYKLLGRIDISKRFPPALTRSTENWLWLQLSLVREEDEGKERYGLTELAEKLVGYGEKHFDPKGTRPMHYFQVLLLCGEFERAVAFLYSRPQHQVDAVHFAAALAYYGLMRVPSSAQTSHVDFLTVETTSSGAPRGVLDFAKLIQRYVRLFSRSDARSALQYLYLICLNSDAPAPAGQEQTKKCHDAIRQLVFETRQYFDLLGDIRSDGTKIPGLIERNLSLIHLANSRDYMSQIVCAAARQSEAEHRTRDAILLYNIAEEYDTVVSVMNRELGLSLFDTPAPSAVADASASGTSGAARLQPEASLAAAEDTAQLARAILDSYEQQNHIVRAITPRKRETCKVLLALKDAVALYAAGELEKTLNTVESLDLIPLNKSDVVSITRAAEQFKDMDEAIARNISHILLLVMETLYKLHGAQAQSPFGDATRQQRMNELRNKARVLMMYAGMLRLRIEQSTFSQLTRLDVFIH